MFQLRTNLTEKCPCDSGKSYSHCCFRKGVCYLNVVFIALALGIITFAFWPWNLLAISIPSLLIALFIRHKINNSKLDYGHEDLDDEEEDDEDDEDDEEGDEEDEIKSDQESEDEKTEADEEST